MTDPVPTHAKPPSEAGDAARLPGPADTLRARRGDVVELITAAVARVEAIEARYAETRQRHAAELDVIFKDAADASATLDALQHQRRAFDQAIAQVEIIARDQAEAASLQSAAEGHVRNQAADGPSAVADAAPGQFTSKACENGDVLAGVVPIIGHRRASPLEAKSE